MEDFQEFEIEKVVDLPWSDEPSKVDPTTYLGMHSVVVLAANTDEDSRLGKPDLDLTVKEHSLSLEFGWAGEAAVAAKPSFGSATPITEDGYYLTAAHVIDSSEVWVAALEFDQDGDPLGVTYPIRKVYVNDETDFAIIKLDHSPVAILSLRETPLRRKELLFAGGVLNKSGAGNFKRTHSLKRKLEDASLKFHEVLSTVPQWSGDSGSPLIDAEGKLCGITVRARKANWAKFIPTSTAVMLDTESIWKLIDEDRAKQQS